MEPGSGTRPQGSRVNKTGGRGAGAAENSVQSLISKEGKENYPEKDRELWKCVVWG